MFSHVNYWNRSKTCGRNRSNKYKEELNGDAHSLIPSFKMDIGWGEVISRIAYKTALMSHRCSVSSNLPVNRLSPSNSKLAYLQKCVCVLVCVCVCVCALMYSRPSPGLNSPFVRSEEHTSELQSR